MLARRYDQKFFAFVRQASATDAGEKAAQEVFGKSLGTIMNSVLGDGDWTPKLPLFASESPGPDGAAEAKSPPTEARP
jgi:hypothetical protein